MFARPVACARREDSRQLHHHPHVPMGFLVCKGFWGSTETPKNLKTVPPIIFQETFCVCVQNLIDFSAIMFLPQPIQRYTQEQNRPQRNK